MKVTISSFKIKLVNNIYNFDNIATLYKNFTLNCPVDGKSKISKYIADANTKRKFTRSFKKNIKYRVDILDDGKISDIVKMIKNGESFVFLNEVNFDNLFAFLRNALAHGNFYDKRKNDKVLLSNIDNNSVKAIGLFSYDELYDIVKLLNTCKK